MSTESKTVLRAAAAPDLVRMQEANRMCVHTVDLCPPVWIFALVCQSCWTQAICALFCSVCVCENVCMTSSLGSVILPSVVCSWECFYYCQQRLSWRAWYYTHIHSLPQRWPPLGQISPCTSSSPAFVYIPLCTCVSVCVYCLPADWINALSRISVCWGSRRCQPASEPIKMLNL